MFLRIIPHSTVLQRKAGANQKRNASYLQRELSLVEKILIALMVEQAYLLTRGKGEKEPIVHLVKVL